MPYPNSAKLIGPPGFSSSARVKSITLSLMISLVVLAAHGRISYGQTQSEDPAPGSVSPDYPQEYSSAPELAKDRYRSGSYSNNGYGGSAAGVESTDAERYPGAYRYSLRSEDDSGRFQPAYEADGQYRQPTSIALLNDQQAFVCTLKGGEIYRLELPKCQPKLVYRDPTASWGEIIRITDSILALADQRGDRVVLLEQKSGELHPLKEFDSPGKPNALAWDAERGVLIASGVWSQRLYRWQLSDESGRFDDWSSRESVDLPMCGGRVLVLPSHGSILVVDAFGRDYAVVNRDDFQVTHHEQLYGHNVADLAATADERMVFFPHQLVNEYARSVRTDITWGGMMSNNLRWLRTERLLNSNGEQVFKQGKFYPLGSPGNGAGDPSSMAVSSRGRVAVTLGGTNRVAIGNEDDYYFRQANVGYRPVDCAYTPDETQLLVVNQFSDSISIVDVESLEVRHVSLGKLRSPDQIERGEQLFFSARLAHDGWMSCQSCHSQGHTNGQLNDNFTDGSYGTPKRVLSLLGQAQTMPYAWGGMIDQLEQQVEHSILSTMAADFDPDRETIVDLAAYIRSLPAPPSLEEARSGDLRRKGALGESVDAFVGGTSVEGAHAQEDLEAGRKIFQNQGCNDCHAGPRFTSAETYDVGLYDQEGMRRFNPPSLIAVSQRQNALFHDARAKSLRDVLVKEKHQLSESLSEQQIEQLIRYLQSL